MQKRDKRGVDTFIIYACPILCTMKDYCADFCECVCAETRIGLSVSNMKLLQLNVLLPMFCDLPHR